MVLNNYYGYGDLKYAFTSNILDPDLKVKLKMGTTINIIEKGKDQFNGNTFLCVVNDDLELISEWMFENVVEINIDDYYHQGAENLEELYEHDEYHDV